MCYSFVLLRNLTYRIILALIKRLRWVFKFMMSRRHSNIMVFAPGSQLKSCCQLKICISNAAFESPPKLVFRLIDVDGSGTITFEELKDACKGMDYDDDKLEELMRQSDADNDGIITLDEMKVFQIFFKSHVWSQIVFKDNFIH